MSAIMFDNPITSTPGPQRSSLRQSLLRKTINREEACNDDDAERSSLVASERVVSSTPSSTGTGRDQSISTTPQKEHYQGCLKLYAENKITKDNAWSLQLIDFMTAMLRRHDQRMDNLATASTVVDASTRIYSFRVDAVHHDVLLMAGGLTKVANTKRGKKDDDADDDGAVDNDAPPLAAKKKKRMKGATAANPEVFNGDFETNLCIDPFFERLSATTGDVTSSNRAFNATLPVHDGTLALVLRTDIPFLPAAEGAAGAAGAAGAGGAARRALPARLLPPFTALDQLCRPFTGFSISDWDPDSEERERPEARLDLSQQAVAFDADAPVEPPPADTHDDLYEDEPLGGIESEEEGDVAVAACVARAAAAPRLASLASLASRADMRPGAPRDARLEYSYCALAAWAGPAHWRLKHARASRAERTQPSAAEGGRRPARARRPLDFLGAGLAAGGAAPAEYEPAAAARIMISRRTLATGPAWSEHNYRTPVDRGLDESFFRRLFVRRSALLARAREPAPEPAPEPARPAEAARDYDYDNENDASYCGYNAQDGSSWAGGEAPARAQAQPLAEDFGDMIEPPTKIAKIFIPYAMRAKKVDMKQLKQVTWRLLTAGAGAGAVQDCTFSSLYVGLGRALGAEARGSLSVPLALLAALHLANERGLVLRARDDLADIDISALHQ